MNTNKVGLVFAAVIGGGHIVWALLVLLGWGQWIMNFVFWMHMIRLPLIVAPFDPIAAITLIACTSALGYIVGWFAAYVWNKTKHMA